MPCQPKVFSMLMRRLFVLSVMAMIALASMADASAAEGRVELELVTERGFSAIGTRDWIKTFSKLGITSIRIRGVRSGDAIEVKTRGTEDRPVYHVTGLLTGRNKVRLPGGATFSQSQSKQIGAWLDKLARLGPDGEEEKTTVFGLKEKQFEQLTLGLSGSVSFKTKDVAVGEVVAQFQQKLTQRVVIGPSAQKALAGTQTVLDDLQGVSYGTALAAALRPAGLVFYPRVTGEKVELVIAKSSDTKELWPIGWKPTKPPARVVPALVKQVNVEIDGITISKTLEAVQGKLEIPFLFDHNAMVRHDVDPTKLEVTIAPGKRIYSSILRRVLYPHLKYEVRVDEAGKPLLWISTRKR